MNTTEGKLYLTALKSLERLDIQFVPVNMTDKRTAIVAGIAVVGRNVPFHHFVGGTKTMPLELDFHAEEENREDVIRKCKWLESLTYSDEFENKLERVRLTFGRMFRPFETWIIQSVDVDYSIFQQEYGMLPKQAYVKLNLILDTDTNLTPDDIKWT